MKFEFDKVKSNANKIKHVINFLEAQALWSDPDYLEIPAKSDDEVRLAIIGKVNGKIWSGFFTYRGDAVRIISVRRARREEVLLYES